MEMGKALPHGSFYITAVSYWDDLDTRAGCRNWDVYYIFLLHSTHEQFCVFYWTRKREVRQHKGKLAKKPHLMTFKNTTANSQNYLMVWH